MDNHSSDQFINNKPAYEVSKPTVNGYELQDINGIQIQENGINPNSNCNAPNPILPTQNVTQNPNPNPYNAPPQGFYNPDFPPNPYPYYPNASQGYPYNQNMAPNQFAYNNNMAVPKPLVATPPNNCLKNMLLVMSILMFIFLIVEMSVLNSYGIYFTNVCGIIDDVGIFTVATIFLISFIFARINKQGINPCIRTAITIVVWFVGFAIRGIGNMMFSRFNNSFILFAFLGIRAFLLFASIPISVLNGQMNN
jgi:hypothetical protein